ncbi:hypothetical protein Ahy_B08g091802 isoform A [Arachis hypogaea]|uniref:Uncharacterized protein n=1 Tax=Arachis hypogaea TaxID=3818 RepID=A0A444Y2R2_ARAHY|nr:hypothetical protein Ahy_B08g091802 isoform A [Arachis hypogaea]
MASVTTHQPQSHDVLHCFSPLSDDDPQRRGLRIYLLRGKLLVYIMQGLEVVIRLLPSLSIPCISQKISKVKDAISIANNACWSIGELVVKIQEKKIKRSSDMNVDHLKAVGNGYSSSNSSSSIPYLANGAYLH